MKSKPVILLFLSDFKKNAQNIEYAAPDGKNYLGAQTNEAPLRYLYETAKLQSHVEPEIMVITSYMVVTKKNEASKTALEEFSDFVRTELSSSIHIRQIEYDIVHDENGNLVQDHDHEACAARVYRQLSEHLKNRKLDLYVDYTGGLRDTSFLMVTILNYLEFYGYQCQKISYSNFFDKKIIDIEYIYDMYHWIAGVNEFLSTGNARLLREEVRDIKPGGKAQAVVDSMIQFSDMISLCDIGRLEEAIQSLSNSIREFEDSTADQDQIFDQMFRTLIPTIEQKLMIREGTIEYPELILWCANNGLVQQAITIYTERMPRYYKEHGFITEEIEPSTHNETSSEEMNWFYTDVYSRLAEDDESEEARLSNKILGVFCEIQDQYNIQTCMSEWKEVMRAKEAKIKDKELKPVFQRTIDNMSRYYDHDGKRICKTDELGSNTPKNVAKLLNSITTQGGIPLLQKTDRAGEWIR